MKKYLLILIFLHVFYLANAQPFNFIVANDGSGTDASIQSAIDKCPDNVRSIIFIKNGTYNEQVSLGSKATASLKVISLIGESTTGVVITHNQSRASSGSPTFEDICTVKLYANDFYAENITIQNTAGNTGMAEALYTAGDRQTFKNCRILGYQDTYRSKKGTRGYFLNCWIEGAVDFIYAGGVEFFDNCTINCVKGGGYITAPEDAILTIPKSLTVCDKFLRVGFFFRNCNITANPDVADNSYYLGRPWNSTSGSFYLNCKLGRHINPVGWKEWNGNETSSSFAEYNSMDANGLPIDVSKRVSWSFQLPQEDVENLLSAEAIYSRVSTTPYNPFSLVITPSAPATLELSGKNLSWTSVAGVAGYVLFKDGNYLGSTSSTAFTDETATGGVYTVKSIGIAGQLSQMPVYVTALKNVQDHKIIAIYKNKSLIFSESVSVNIFSMDGKLLSSNKSFLNSLSIENINEGPCFIQMINPDGIQSIEKLIITHN